MHDPCGWAWPLGTGRDDAISELESAVLIPIEAAAVTAQANCSCCTSTGGVTGPTTLRSDKPLELRSMPPHWQTVAVDNHHNPKGWSSAYLLGR
jgi:hypothetical protein